MPRSTLHTAKAQARYDSAIIRWGPDHRETKAALRALRHAMRADAVRDKKGA